MARAVVIGLTEVAECQMSVLCAVAMAAGASATTPADEAETSAATEIATSSSARRRSTPTASRDISSTRQEGIEELMAAALATVECTGSTSSQVQGISSSLRTGPLSPLPAAAHYSLSGDPSDDAFSSSLLTQFSSSSTLDELTGHIYAIAKDQYGCRLLQRMLDEQQPAGLCDLVFSECYEHINELMTDAFGNYLMQKLIEHCHESQRVAIIGRAAADLVAIALNMHGTRAVQKMVETVTTAKEVEVVIAALRSSVVTLIKDLNGNHVIQRCLHHLSSADNQFIYDAVSRHCVSVSTHKHGCCVLQRCIDYATAGQKRQLVQEVVNNALELVQDAFGNYVVQYVLDLGDAQVTGGVIQNLLGHISSLSVQKFSSNVVEKCLELASEKLRAKMIDELINAERLPRLLQDPYANYVLQKALTVSKRQQFERLVTAIKPHLLSLKNTSFGKRIQSKIVRKFPHLGLAQDVEELSAGGGADQGGHGPHGRSHQLGGGGHLGQGGQQQQHYSQQQSHPALLQSGVAVGSALRGYGAVSPSTALQQSMLQQQQLALQQLSHQHQLLQQGGGGVGSVGGGTRSVEWRCQLWWSGRCAGPVQPLGQRACAAAVAASLAAHWTPWPASTGGQRLHLCVPLPAERHAAVAGLPAFHLAQLHQPRAAPHAQPQGWRDGGQPWPAAQLRAASDVDVRDDALVDD